MSIKTRFGFVLQYFSDVETAKEFYVEVTGLEALASALADSSLKAASASSTRMAAA